MAGLVLGYAGVSLPTSSAGSAASRALSRQYSIKQKIRGDSRTSMTFSIVTYANNHFDGVDALWRDAFPNDSAWNAAHISIPEKLKIQPDLLLVAVEGDHVVGVSYGRI